MPTTTDADSIRSKTLAMMAKNAVANLLRNGTGWVVLLLLPPLLVRMLDKPTYAVWLLLLQLAAYATAFDWGIQAAVARYVARAEALRDREYLARLLSSCGMLMILASAVTVLLTLLASWQLPYIFRQVPDSIAQGARLALLIMGVSLALTLPSSVLAGFFVGMQRNEITAFSISIGKIAGACGTAWAACHHQGLPAMALWLAAGNLMQCFIYVAFWNREGTRELLHYSRVERAVAREFLVFCGVMLVSQFSSILIAGLDMPVVAAFDFRSAAYYGVALTLTSALTVPFGAIISTLLPVAAGVSACNDPQRLGHVLVKTTRIGSVLLCLLTLPLLVLLPRFLQLWVGADYASHTLVFAEILVIAQFVRLTMLPYATIGFAAGQQQRMLVSPLVEGFVNLACSLAAVQFIGALGVALGTLIGALVGVGLHFLVSLRRTDCLAVSRAQLMWQGLLKPLACATPVLLVCMVTARRVPSAPLQLALVAAAEAALFALLWHLSLDEADREQFRAMVRRFPTLPAKLLPSW